MGVRREVFVLGLFAILVGSIAIIPVHQAYAISGTLDETLCKAVGGIWRSQNQCSLNETLVEMKEVLE